jgi:hypothetical protein
MKAKLHLVSDSMNDLDDQVLRQVTGGAANTRIKDAEMMSADDPSSSGGAGQKRSSGKSRLPDLPDNPFFHRPSRQEIHEKTMYLAD